MNGINGNYSYDSTRNPGAGARGILERAKQNSPDKKSAPEPGALPAGPSTPPTSEAKQPVGEKNRKEMSRYFPGLYSGQASTAAMSPSHKIQQEVKNDPERKKLYDTATEFQAIFVNMMLKSMRATLKPKEGMFFGGLKQEIFEDMLYDEYGKSLSRNGKFKLADQLYLELSRNMGAAKTSPPENKDPAALELQRAGRRYQENLNKHPENVSTGEIRRL